MSTEPNQPASAGAKDVLLGDLAHRIALSLKRDIRDRRGLKQEWDQIAEDTQEEILTEWTKLIGQQLSPLLLKAPSKGAPSYRDWEKGLSDKERTFLGIEVWHDLRCDHEGDHMEKPRWNSTAMAKALASIHIAEKEAFTQRALLVHLRDQIEEEREGGMTSEDVLAMVKSTLAKHVKGGLNDE